MYIFYEKNPQNSGITFFDISPPPSKACIPRAWNSAQNIADTQSSFIELCFSSLWIFSVTKLERPWNRYKSTVKGRKMLPKEEQKFSKHWWGFNLLSGI